MFAISYRIINYTNELPIGADGYIRFDCGKYHYGEIFPPELDLVMDISSIYGWIQALIKAAELINEEIPYILIRDIESYNTYYLSGTDRPCKCSHKKRTHGCSS